MCQLEISTASCGCKLFKPTFIASCSYFRRHTDIPTQEECPHVTFPQRHVVGICSSHARTRALEKRIRDDKRDIQEEARMRRERDDQLMGFGARDCERGFGGFGERGHRERGGENGIWL